MLNQIKIENFKSEFGELILGSFEDKLCLCDWFFRKRRTEIDNRIKSYLKADYIPSPSDVSEITKTQLKEYFKCTRKEFDIPLLFCGTDFQKGVWNELLKIPFGKTNSYLELSKKMNAEKAIRAVAGANGANAISILVPCHRIIGTDGNMIGYAGGLETKRKLLALEGALNENQIKLFE